MTRAVDDLVARAARFAGDCRVSTVELQAERLREAHALFASDAAPPRALPRADAIEEMIAAQAFDSAALALVGADRPFVLSRGGSGMCMATLIAARTGAEVSAEGASPALALLAAAALAAAEDRREPVTRKRHRFYTPAARVD